MEKVLYFESFIIVEPGLTTLKKGQLISEEALIKAQEEFGEDAFTAGIGAEAVREILVNLDLKKAKEILDKKGIKISIIDARFAKPLDEKLILEIASNHELILTIEEGSIGGFGSHVMKLLSDRGVFDKGLKFRSMFLPDIFIDQDTPEKMYEKAGLNFNSIVEKIEEALKSNIIFAKNKNKFSN